MVKPFNFFLILLKTDSANHPNNKWNNSRAMRSGCGLKGLGLESEGLKAGVGIAGGGEAPL